MWPIGCSFFWASLFFSVTRLTKVPVISRRLFSSRSFYLRTYCSYLARSLFVVTLSSTRLNSRSIRAFFSRSWASLSELSCTLSLSWSMSSLSASACSLSLAILNSSDSTFLAFYLKCRSKSSPSFIFCCSPFRFAYESLSLFFSWSMNRSSSCSR